MTKNLPDKVFPDKAGYKQELWNTSNLLTEFLVPNFYKRNFSWIIPDPVSIRKSTAFNTVDKFCTAYYRCEKDFHVSAWTCANGTYFNVATGICENESPSGHEGFDFDHDSTFYLILPSTSFHMKKHADFDSFFIMIKISQKNKRNKSEK